MTVTGIPGAINHSFIFLTTTNSLSKKDKVTLAAQESLSDVKTQEQSSPPSKEKVITPLPIPSQDTGSASKWHKKTGWMVLGGIATLIAGVGAAAVFGRSFYISDCFKQASNALDNGHVSMAQGIYKGIIEQENLISVKDYSEACYNLALLYKIKTPNVEQNPKKAAFYLKKAANKGHKNAECELSGMYLDGSGVPVDYKKAAIFSERAANQGDAKCQYRSALLCEEGFCGEELNGEQKIKKTAKFLQLAAEQGDPSALFRLSLYYGNGWGVEANPLEADRLLQKSLVYESLPDRDGWVECAIGKPAYLVNSVKAQ